MKDHTDRQKACSEAIQALFQPWPDGELGPTDEPESQYRFGYNTALEDVLAAVEKSITAFSEPAGAGDVRGWKLAMRVLQSDLYGQLDDAERAECDALVRANPYIAAPSQPAAPAVDVAGVQGEATALNYLRNLLENEIAHAEINDLRLQPNFGKVTGDLAIRSASIQACLDNPKTSAVAPYDEAHGIPGLVTATDEDDGRVTLQFIDEQAASSFMLAYGPTVDIDAAPSQPAAPAEQSPLMTWQDGVGLLWDVYGHGKWIKRVVSPLKWDAHAVYLDMQGARYAPHIDVRLVSSANNSSLAAPAVDECATCNGHGMIGGPSYYAPDEGGDPCPDCAAPATTPAALADLDGSATVIPVTPRELAGLKNAPSTAAQGATLTDERPTKAMLEAAQHYQRHEYVYDEFCPHKLYEGIYLAMLAATPTPVADSGATIDEQITQKAHAVVRIVKEIVREKPTAKNAYGLKCWQRVEDAFAGALAADYVAAAKPVSVDARKALIEECCAAIKAADDESMKEDVMLDSDQCIQVLRALLTPPTESTGEPNA